MHYFSFLVFLLALSQGAHVPDRNNVIANDAKGNGPYGTNEYEPEQIHLSNHDDPTSMTVTWMTKSDVPSFVRFGVGALNTTAEGTSTKFETGNREEYIHRAVMKELVPGTRYDYVVGSQTGWSDLKFFKALPEGTEWSPRLAVYGDMGVENARALERLQLDTEEGMYDAVLHIGDIAYDLDDDDGKVGDEFMRMIEPVAAHVPYMTVAGNHEKHDNFSEYKARFTMPGDGENLFYKFDLGPVQLVAVNSEFYYYLQYGKHMAVNQYNWLEKVLMEANTPGRRDLHPWLVVYGHRPMYCSNFQADKDCLKQTDLLRVGIPEENIPGMEPLLKKYGVDLAIWGHVHAYERSWPIFDNVVMNGTDQDPYYNPGAPVHLITGSGGTESHGTTPKGETADWSAFRSVDYGFTRLTFHNYTHMSLEQVSEDQDGAIIDSVWLQKKSHFPYDQLSRTEDGFVKL